MSGEIPGIVRAKDVMQKMVSIDGMATAKEAAQKMREIYATYTDAEDLISIGAFSPGSNKRIDGSVALIDRIQNFLIQDARERTDFDETVKTLTDIAQAWDRLLSDDAPRLPAAAGAAGKKIKS